MLKNETTLTPTLQPPSDSPRKGERGWGEGVYTKGHWYFLPSQTQWYGRGGELTLCRKITLFPFLFDNR